PDSARAPATLSLHDALPILIVDRWVPGSRPLEDFEDGAREVVLRLRGWGVLPTDAARFVLHYAAHPEDRAELADSEAVTARLRQDRKSTRLNSSHVKTSYAV